MPHLWCARSIGIPRKLFWRRDVAESCSVELDPRRLLKTSITYHKNPHGTSQHLYIWALTTFLLSSAAMLAEGRRFHRPAFRLSYHLCESGFDQCESKLEFSRHWPCHSPRLLLLCFYFLQNASQLTRTPATQTHLWARRPPDLHHIDEITT